MTTTSSPLRAAIVGAGEQAWYHLQAYKKTLGVEPVVCCDIDGERARRFGREHGLRPYGSLKDLLGEERIDVFSVCTPPAAHAPNVLEILDATAGSIVGILCEKPPALTLDEIDEMTGTAAQQGAVLTFGFHLRQGAARWLRDLVGAGELGDIYHLELEWVRCDGRPRRGVFTNKELSGGGPGMDLGPHLKDLGLYLLGYPTLHSVVAVAHSRIADAGGIHGDTDPATITVEDALSGLALWQDETPDGTKLGTLQFLTTWEAHAGADRQRIRVMGTEGGASLELVQRYDFAGNLIEEGHGPKVFGARAGKLGTFIPRDQSGFPTVAECYPLELRDLAAVVRERRNGHPEAQTLVTPEQAREVMRLVLGAYESAAAGGAQIDLRNELEEQ